MDGPENELGMVVLKKRINAFFPGLTIFFCNSNFIASSTIHGEMHGGGGLLHL